MTGRRSVVGVLAVLVAAGCVSGQSVHTPAAIQISPGSTPTPSSWTAADQAAAVVWLAGHLRPVKPHHWYGVVVTSGRLGDGWTGVLILPSGRAVLIGGEADLDLLVQRGDAVDYNQEGYGLSDVVVIVAKQAIGR